MSGQRTTPFVVVVAFLLLVPAAAYVGSYLALGRTIYCSSYPGGIFAVDGEGLTGGRIYHVARFYDAEWQVTAFGPLGKLEAAVRRISVDTKSRSVGQGSRVAGCS
jgi:hypothetical protein